VNAKTAKAAKAAKILLVCALRKIGFAFLAIFAFIGAGAAVTAVAGQARA
jgi:hypothetical protein